MMAEYKMNADTLRLGADLKPLQSAVVANQLKLIGKLSADGKMIGCAIGLDLLKSFEGAHFKILLVDNPEKETDGSDSIAIYFQKLPKDGD